MLFRWNTKLSELGGYNTRSEEYVVVLFVLLYQDIKIKICLLEMCKRFYPVEQSSWLESETCIFQAKM